MLHSGHFCDSEIQKCCRLYCSFIRMMMAERMLESRSLRWYAVTPFKEEEWKEGYKNPKSSASSRSSLEGAKINQNLTPSEKIWRGMDFVAEIVVCWEGTKWTKWIAWSWQDTVDYSGRQLPVLSALPFSFNISWNEKSIKKKCYF